MTIRVFSIVLFCSCVIFSQNYKGVTSTPQSDSTKYRFGASSFLNNYVEEGLNLSSEMNHLKLFLPLEMDSTNIWLATRMQINNLVVEDPVKSNFNMSVLNPLKQQFAESQTMKELKYILATIQVGAVGYLAYKHIEKYGFIYEKKKK
jgi:hypothetical protein